MNLNMLSMDSLFYVVSEGLEPSFVGLKKKKKKQVSSSILL